MSGEESGEELPKLVEVEAPSTKAKIYAICIGTQELLIKEISKLLESENNISREDFVQAFLVLFEQQDDAMHLIAKSNIFPDCSSQSEEIESLEALINQQPLSQEKCRELLMVLLNAWEISYDDDLNDFHSEFDSLTVFITSDGRIATGKYVDS